MPYEMIAITMFASMMVLMATGQRVFAAIGAVAAIAGIMLWGTGGHDIPFTAAMKLMNWYPLLTLPMFIFMGYILSESKIADDLYKMFHVWMGPLHGGLAIGTIGLMVLVSAMNGLSVAGMAIGATIALPELLRDLPSLRQAHAHLSLARLQERVGRADIARLHYAHAHDLYLATGEGGRADEIRLLLQTLD
jgi:TRAP-type mannitol/chloroaromatic compound transport system permease large subunit